MTEKTIKKLKPLPVYLPADKYAIFQALCEKDRLPMTRVAEAEIDKYIKRKQS